MHDEPPSGAVSTPPTPRAIEDAAIDWFVRLGGEPIDAHERARFRRWLAADARHRHAYRRVVRLWQRLHCVRDLALEATARN
jgi:transmembrane sensor